jgi:hypothetical protein
MNTLLVVLKTNNGVGSFIMGDHMGQIREQSENGSIKAVSVCVSLYYLAQRTKDDPSRETSFFLF